MNPLDAQAAEKLIALADALWQQSHEDLSQPLVMNFLSTEEVGKILG